MTACPALRPDGTAMDALNIRPGDIDWPWIASSLSRLNRFNGGPPLNTSCSVAQHACLGADALRTETADALLAATFLLQDAHEWCLGNVTPLAATMVAESFATCPAARKAFARSDAAKQAIHAAIYEARRRIDRVIFKEAGIPAPHDLPEQSVRILTQMERRLTRAEAMAIFGPESRQHMDGADLPPVRIEIRPWGAMKAEEEWLKRLDQLLGIRMR